MNVGDQIQLGFEQTSRTYHLEHLGFAKLNIWDLKKLFCFNIDLTSRTNWHENDARFRFRKNVQSMREDQS